MSRFLFVVPPLTGHVNPTVSVARELTARGHSVAWVGHPRAVRPLLPDGASLHALDDDVPEQLTRSMREKADASRWLPGLKFLWEDFFVPLCRAMRPGVAAAIRAFEPAVVVADQQALAGGLEARRAGLPWATFATTSAGVTEPLDALPKVKAWVQAQLAALQREAELDPVDWPDRSPHCVVVFSTRALVGEDRAFPAHYRFVGPSINARAETTPFPWESLRDGPRVLVSLGTVNADRGERFYATVLDAFRGLPLQIVLAAPPALVPAAPENVLVRAYVPQLALLPHVQAVVCHGGHNTVCEALAHGLPLVVAPIKDDQPVVAEQVCRAGAGIRVKFGRVQAPELRQATLAVLDEPRYRDAARRIAASFTAAGGAVAAADALEALA